MSPEYKDLLSKLIHVKPERRLTLKEIMQHPWYTKFPKTNSFGINVGFDRIPIDDKIFPLMETLGYSGSQAKRYLSFNVKNECTTAYYLYLKKQFKVGESNSADICSDSFN